MAYLQDIATEDEVDKFFNQKISETENSDNEYNYQNNNIETDNTESNFII